MSEQREHHDLPVRRLPGAQRAQAFNEPPMDDPQPRSSFDPPIPAQRTDSPASAAPGEPAAAPLAAVSTAPSPSSRPGPGDQVSGWSQFGQPPSAGESAGYSSGGWTPPAAPEKPAEWGRKRQLVRVLSFGLAKAKPGQEELQHRENIRAVRQGSWPRCARIVVANPKGGAGKTPLAVALAGKLAQIRGGGVVVWDAADAAGTTGARSETPLGRCISEVQAQPDLYSQPGTIAAAVATQSSFADILGSLTDREFDESSVQRLLWTLDRSYRISVADTGNVPHSPAFKELMRRADLLVIPSTITKDSVDKACALLQRMQDSPTGLLQRAVVAVMHHRGPQTPGLEREIDSIFHAHGVGAVVHIPFEPVLAAGTSITLSDFSHESDIAWTRLAAAVATNLITAPERN